MISVLIQSSPYLALKTTQKVSVGLYFSSLINEQNYEKFEINIPFCTPCEEALFDYLSGKYPNADLFIAFEPSFRNELALIEQKHPQKRTTMKIGVVYCKDGQVNAPDMLSNSK